MPFNKKSLIFVLFLSLNLISITSYSKPSEKKSQPRRAYSEGRMNTEKVAYKIEAQLLPEESKLLGSTTIKWVNPTKIPARSLRFHLFYNAFQNEKTTLLKELEFYRKSKKELDAYQFGEIKIKEMRIIEGEELTHKIKTISPDDQNLHDRTVMEVKLKDPVKPLQAITIKISYILMIPEIIDRTGRADDYFFMSLWYPKIGVLQQDGTWNCHQYHKDSGFFANFGTYQVAITLPEKFIIGATGNLEGKTKNADGTYTFVFKEKNIHSFTWVAYPHFKEIIEKISLKGNRTETKIVLLLPPHHRKEKQRYLDALKFSLQYYAENIFPYPYKKITLVVPPYQAIKSANHSYPGLISLYSWTIIPRKFLLPERNTIQEFG
ncbi:MAG: hypothetical protein KAT17_10680, partial [Candidatus Aminicenantes bacterium]|nr:hypothetical protein [Candidatus Aminicenantes bacterium]